MKIAVLEFLCGGGLLEQDTRSEVQASALHELFGEGLLMLEALTTDLVQCGHTLLTCLDRSLLTIGLVSVSWKSRVAISIVEPKDRWLDRWIDISLDCDLTIVIAPELDSQLKTIVETLREHGANVLASTEPFLQATSDKLITSKDLTQSALSHPATWTLLEYTNTREIAADLFGNSPMTVKRRDGAGCSDMKYFDNADAFQRWAVSTDASDLFRANQENWIVQPWIAGRSASLALIAHGEYHVLGAFEQRIELDRSTTMDGVGIVRYRGGVGPIENVSCAELREFSDRVLMALPERAKGWIGIDFLIPCETEGPRDWVVIEINPRLTTSYLGYRQWYGPELANRLIEFRPMPNEVDFQNWNHITFDA